MKKILIALLPVLITAHAYTQNKPKPAPKKPAQTDMEKAMEEMMKGASKEEQEELRKMMKDVMPALNEANAKTASYPEFTDNKKLMPAKKTAIINSIPKSALTNAEISSNTAKLYEKLMTVVNKEEKAIISTIIGKEKTADGLMSASVTMFLQGQRGVAMALAMKAVIAKPNNIVFQNNLAATLTQSGLPDKAIPYLRKLLLQYPGNSTLNNNMGHAWFYLGEPDSASKYIAVALMRNPEYAEARICRGILDELKGDPVKAVKEYTQAFEEIPNVLSDKMLENRKAPKPIEKTDYQKLISEVTIYEYFTDDWCRLPAVKNTVKEYEKNKGLNEGYKKMHDELTEKVKQMSKDASKQLDALMKNEDEFVKTMAKENLGGLNMLSKPALYVIAILSNEQKRMVKDNNDEYMKLIKEINEQKEIQKQVPSDAKCSLLDEKADQFMEAVNPKIEAHWKKRLEEFRVWLNAWCTWRWYITGNVQNSVTVECLEWVNGFLDLRAAALRDFKIETPYCREYSSTAASIEKLFVPPFACPAIVQVPVNLHSLKLGAQAIEASHDNYGVKITQGKMPNVSISFGIDNTITEPGLYGNPYLKTAEGSISQSGNTYADNNDEDELVPLAKIPPVKSSPDEDELVPLQKIPPSNSNTSDKDELVPLSKIPPSNSKPANKRPGEVTRADEIALIKAMLARKMMNKSLNTDCFKMGKGELTMEEPETIVMLPGTLEFNGEVSVFDPATGTWKNKPKGKIVVGVGELIWEEGPAPEKPTGKIVVGPGELIWPGDPAPGSASKKSVMKTTLSNAVELIEIHSYSERELNNYLDNKK